MERNDREIYYICNLGYGEYLETMNAVTKHKLIEWAEKYNDPQYFQEDPIAFPNHFARKYQNGQACLQDVEISALLAAHLAWGRRAMIVRDCNRMFDQMEWRPYDYVMAGEYRDDQVSMHRTIKWCDFAGICARLRDLYSRMESLESLTDSQLRVLVYGQKEDRKAPNKKICMMRRWMVRDDGKVDLGLWRNSDKKDLVIPLDVHVYTQATELGLTCRKPKDIVTALQITDALREVFPDDPLLGDFALFGYGVTCAASSDEI